MAEIVPLWIPAILIREKKRELRAEWVGAVYAGTNIPSDGDDCLYDRAG